MLLDQLEENLATLSMTPTWMRRQQLYTTTPTDTLDFLSMTPTWMRRQQLISMFLSICLLKLSMTPIRMRRQQLPPSTDSTIQ